MPESDRKLSQETGASEWTHRGYTKPINQFKLAGNCRTCMGFCAVFMKKARKVIQLWMFYLGKSLTGEWSWSGVTLTYSSYSYATCNIVTIKLHILFIYTYFSSMQVYLCKLW